jgi:hypothetical protein
MPARVGGFEREGGGGGIGRSEDFGGGGSGIAMPTMVDFGSEPAAGGGAGGGSGAGMFDVERRISCWTMSLS